MTEYTLSHESQATEPLESPRDDDSLDGIETPKSPETRSHSTTDYTSDEPSPKPNAAEPQEELREEKQCRICLDGVEAESELGRLIRPCLCKGSISHVHIKCLQRWRETGVLPSTSETRFFSCPNCKYRYRFSRTKALGIAENPIVVGGISALLFTLLVLLSSHITGFLIGMGDSDPLNSTWFYISPITVTQELIRAGVRVIQDELGVALLTPDEVPAFAQGGAILTEYPKPRSNPGFFMNLLRRFLLGLPMVGAGSLISLLFSMPFLGPLQWLARYRGSRRRENSRDVAALIIIGLLVFGSLRALYKVYEWTQSITRRILLRAEDAILEVK